MNDSSSTSKPEVSVLMACYNSGRWVKEAIESILAQTYETFEFIIINDGSTDDTPEIIRNYRMKDKRIVTLSKPNTGLIDSLNAGLALARGTWIARLDADDLCEPTRLEEQVRFSRDHSEVVLLGTGAIEINEQGMAKKIHCYPSGHDQLVFHLERLKKFFPHSSAFYRLDRVRQIKGYNPRIRKAEDRRLWLELISYGKIACLPKPLVRIRVHPDQISLENSGRRQLYDVAAATTCHFLQKACCVDPSSPKTGPDDWTAFLNWIENRVERSGTFERQIIWREARNEFLEAENKLGGLLGYTRRIMQSGYALSLLREKIVGSYLPLHLAQEWMKQGCLAL